MSKVIYMGLESSGKSLKLSMVAVELAYRNAKWQSQTGVKRPIYSNLHFTESFFSHVTQELGVPILYWRNLDELIRVSNADVLCDEIGTYFDSRLWTDLSLDVRRWLSQAAKSGVEMYGTAQDFAQVDKAFRRLVNELYEITKVIGSPRPSATRPPVTRIWGVCAVRPVNPRSYAEDAKQYLGFFPSFFTIQRKYCDIFDTTQKIQRSEYPALRHEARRCERHVSVGGDGSCDFCKVYHV